MRISRPNSMGAKRSALNVEGSNSKLIVAIVCTRAEEIAMLPHPGLDRPDQGEIVVSANIYHIRHEIARGPSPGALR
jgi:hypothetical protein